MQQMWSVGAISFETFRLPTLKGAKRVRALSLIEWAGGN